MFKRGRREQQISMDDRFMNVPKSITEQLQKSWADQFYRDVFLSINEDRFSVLFSETYSRPNKPVNILVSLLILKELHQLTDEELIGALYFDYRYQYALGISHFEQESLCINTLTNFRQRLVAYELKTKTDLMKEEVDAISNQLANVIQLDRSMARMDSLMISSSCKKMTRLELVFKVILDAVKSLNRLDTTLVTDSFRVYLEKEHQTEVLYHTKQHDATSKLEQQLQMAAELQRVITSRPELTDDPAFQRLSRLLREQCVETEEGDLIPVPQTKSTDLQSATDPDATFRTKGGEGHVGYTMNAVEVRDPEKQVGLILSHSMEKNVHSDAEFGQQFVENDPLTNQIETLVADGAYYRPETVEAANQKNVEFVLSDMSGRKAAENQIGVDQFETDEDQHIVKCPAGHAPAYTNYDQKKQVFTAKFSKTLCSSCPFQVDCPAKEQKKFNTVRFTKNKRQTDQFRGQMKTERYRQLAKFRAGVEGVMSVLRRRFRIDEMPVLGFVRSKIWVHAKIMAYNFRMVLKYRERAV